MPLLDQDGREALLAEVRVAVLSVARSEGGPLAVPIWYEYRDGLLWMDTETSNLHGRLMQARGRATLTVQDDQVPYRYVTAEGPVEFRGDEPEVARRIAVRYIGDEGAEQLLKETRPMYQPNAETAVLTPERWWAAWFPAE